MAKYKIEIEIDVDFQKHFDSIKYGLFPDDETITENYERESIHGVLKRTYTDLLAYKVKMMSSEHYENIKHHIDIDIEIAKEIINNINITKE